eukprot:260381-Chlamydomonas_euryale.AAC.1
MAPREGGAPGGKGPEGRAAHPVRRGPRGGPSTRWEGARGEGRCPSVDGQSGHLKQGLPP